MQETEFFSYKQMLYDKANSNKWYMDTPEFIPVNETRTFLSDFEIQTDHQIFFRRPYLVIIKKKICTSRFAILAEHRLKIKRIKKRDKYLDLARQLGTLGNMRLLLLPIVIDLLGTITTDFERGFVQ